tara:strand:+ start:143 stop:1018 length:876 start_codon:yes stop_codon:yes gene_type:complete
VPKYPRIKKTEQIRGLFQRVATTNHYEVFFSGFGALQQLRGYISSRSPRVTNFFISRDLGLLCNSAELPATTMATAQVEGQRMGIVEKMAHSRVFTDVSFTFYVDNQYRTLEFFELWHEFIASGSNNEVDRSNIAYYHRMQYPDEYKVDTIKIQKFDKDHFRSVEYNFLNCFPVSISSMPVAYDGNQVLECQVTFAYDRYYFGKISSLDRRNYNKNYANVSTGDAVGNTNKVEKKEVIYKEDGLESTGFTLTEKELNDIKQFNEDMPYLDLDPNKYKIIPLPNGDYKVEGR